MQYCSINPKLFRDSGGLELGFWRGICDICRMESSNQLHGDAQHSSSVHSTFPSTAFIKDLKWDKLCSLVETKTAGRIRYFKCIYLGIYQCFYMKGWWTERVLKELCAFVGFKPELHWLPRWFQGSWGFSLFLHFLTVLSSGLQVHSRNFIHKFETNLPCKQIGDSRGKTANSIQMQRVLFLCRCSS